MVPHRMLIRSAVIVFIVCAWFTHLIPSTNDGSRFALGLAIVQDQTLEIGKYYDAMLGPAAVDKAIYEGKTYSDKAPLGGLLAAIPLAISTKLTSSAPWNLLVASIFISALSAGCVSYCLGLLAFRLGVPRRAAAVLGMAAIFSTNLFYWSTGLYSHTLTAALILGGITLIYESKQPLVLAVAGLCSGLAVSSDYYVLIFLPITGAWCWSLRGKKTAWYVAGAAIAGLLPMWYHWVLFDNPLTLPYKYQATYAHRHSEGVYGIELPCPTAAVALLFGLPYGLYLYNLSAFAVLPAGRQAWAKNREFTLMVIGLGIILLALVAGHKQEGYGFGASWGPRYFAPLLPLLLLPAAAAWNHSRLRTVAYIGMAISALLNTVFVMQFHLPEVNEGLRALFADGRGLAFVLKNGPACIPAQIGLIKGSPAPLTATITTALLFAALASWWCRPVRLNTQPAPELPPQSDPPQENTPPQDPDCTE